MPSEVAVFEAALKRAAQRPCILCNHTPACGSGAWMPGNDSDRRILNTPAGKMRVAFYALCERCRAKPNSLERVEESIRANTSLKN
jgi:hypothetical protein